MRHLHLASFTTRSLVAVFLVGASACSEGPAALTGLQPPQSSLAAVQGATRTHTEFSGSDNLEIYFSCVDEVVKYVVTYTASLDIITSASGVQNIRLTGRLDPGSYVERANGVRYYAFGHAQSRNHELVGPVHVLGGALPQLFRSADGEVLVSNFAYQIVFDGNGDPVVTQFTGACP